MIKKKLIIVILIFIVFSCGKDENEKIQVDDVTEIEEEIESFDELPIKAIDFDISLPTDSNINIEDLTISTLVDEVTSMSSGSLNIFESDGFELVFIENSEGTILLYSLVKTSETNLVIINAESTALSLIMMHPWAMNFTPKAKQEMMSYVKGLDLFDTFVNEVEVGINGQDFGNLNIDFIVDAVVDNLKTGSKDSVRLLKRPLDFTVTNENINLKSSGSVLSYGVRLTNEDGEVQNETYKLNGEGDLVSFDRIVDIFIDPSSAFSQPEINIPVPSDGRWTVVAKNGKPFDDDSEENLLARRDNLVNLFANLTGLFSSTIKGVIKKEKCKVELGTFLLDKVPNLLKDFSLNNDPNFLVKGMLDLFGGLVNDTFSVISSCSGELPSSNRFFGKISKVFKLLNIFKRAESAIQLLTFGTNWAFDNSPEEFCFTQSDNELFYCEGLEISGDLDFQEGGVGTTASKTIQIYNALTETVLISNIILPNGFISNWESGEIIPFNSQSIEITFKPKELIDYSGEIVFETDAFSENIKYPISGKGVYNIFSDTIAFKEFWGANNQDTTDTRWKSNDKIELIDFLNKDIPDIGVGIENERISSLSIQVEQDFRQISTIPESFQNISNLKFLELETNLLEELPDSFGNLDNLEHLNLDGNKFVQFPSAITKLDKLETLTLNFNGIESIPKEINNMTSLINLSISGSNIKELPSEIGELVNLETFALGSSLLETFPLDLLNLINLKSLSLSGNNIEVLPNEISRLSNLISFGLNDNNLVEIPEGLFELRNLKSLYVQDNQLNFIPETDSKLVNLESLYLDGNKLVRLPESIGVSNQLRTLWLHNNLLVGLPNSIGNLNKVTEFRINNNRLQELPSTISGLESMTSLFFNENLLTTIPETIGNMTNLRVLNLENNLISSIPNSIGISNIVQLVLNQNNLSINGLPENILFNGSFTSIFLIGNNNLNCLYKSWWDSEVQISTDLVNGDTNCN